MFLRSILPATLCLLLTVGASVTAAESDGPGDALLPPRLKSWERESVLRVPARSLDTFDPRNGALLREYGSQEAARASYSTGDRRWEVTVHRMFDRSAAYGAFTMLRQGAQGLNLGEDAARTAEALLFYQSNFLVIAGREADEVALQTLADHLKIAGGSQSSLPYLPDFLPRQGLIPGSERYLLGPLSLARVAPLAAGDWVGFTYGAEAELARYELAGENATLLLISYPTPQIALARLQEWQGIFNLNESGTTAQPRAFVRRTGTLVAFVSGEVSPKTAEDLIQNVRYGRELAWSEPGRRMTEEAWLESISNIFIGTGVMILFALMLGLAFAGFRLLVSWLWPGKIFNRPEDSVIRLRIGGKD